MVLITDEMLAGRDRKKVICLHDSDNVVVCIDPIKAGETVQLGDRNLLMRNNISVGHKIARADIGDREKIIKYGVSIGSASCPISAGEHVHTHNMRSDYIHTHTSGKDKGHT